MRPRILILMHYMEIGGAESALLGLLQSHSPEKADIDLFLYDHRGELLNYIPNEKVNILPPITQYSLLERPISELLKRGFFGIAFARILGKIQSLLYSRKNNKTGLDDASAFTYQQKNTIHFLPKINPEINYDLAISFLTPHYIVLDKVNAKKKMGWIHTDYTNIFVNPKLEEKMWGRLDYIASISEDVGTKFLTLFPSLKKKIIPIENILNAQFICNRANEFSVQEINKKGNEITFLTIGRYSSPKRLDIIPEICKRIIDQGIVIKWYIIGYGSSEEECKIRSAIKENKMEANVILLGKKENPYPYIKACDFYVQPSKYEGKSVTVREAQILGKTAIITNYPTASSQVINGVDGIIVPMEIDDCVKEIVSTIRNNAIQKQISSYLSSHNYGNESEINKLYELL